MVNGHDCGVGGKGFVFEERVRNKSMAGARRSFVKGHRCRGAAGHGRGAAGAQRGTAPPCPYRGRWYGEILQNGRFLRFGGTKENAARRRAFPRNTGILEQLFLFGKGVRGKYLTGWTG